MSNQIDQLCINTVRFLSIDAVQQANSGHPGMPLRALCRHRHHIFGRPRQTLRCIRPGRSSSARVRLHGQQSGRARQSAAGLDILPMGDH